VAAALERARAAGVGVVVAVGGDPASNDAVLALAAAHPGVYPALGCHPERLDLGPAVVEAVVAQLEANRSRVVALGEVGLPWYALAERVDAVRLAAAGRERFGQLLAAAARLGLPVSLHAPHGAAAVALALLEARGAGPAVFHWHKADPAVTRRIVDAGHLVGITPEVAWRERDQALVRLVGLDHVVPESDGPWRYGAETGEPAMVARVAAAVASVLGRPADEVAAALAANARRWLQLP
jgi:TatD DNase family protein